MITWNAIKTAAALVALLMLGAAGLVPAAAQESTGNLYESLPGLETVHARMYAQEHDLAAELAATPDPAGESNATSQLIITVLEFETPEDAEATFAETLNDDIAAQTVGAVDTGFTTSEDVDDLGDWAHIYLSEAPEGENYPVRGLLLVQDGNLGFMIQSFADDDSTREQLTAIAEFMVDAEPGDAPVVVDDNGFASGGTFDMLPGGDDDVLGPLVPRFDYDLLVSGSPLEPSATPQA